tara:strand:+ start:6087 stop:6821 length:735 start_codon:yes stop_codon:yes gene_type:complete
MADGNHNFEKEFKDLGKLAGSVTESHKKTLQWMQGMKEIGTAFLLAFLGIFTVIPELLFHTTHGLRFLKNSALIFSLIAFGFITSVGLIPLFGSPDPKLAGLIVVFTVIVYTRRRSKAIKRFRQGEIIHSKSTSDPYAFWYWIPGMSTQWRVIKIAEPLAFILIGIAWRFLFGSSMGSYLIVCGVAMHMKCMVIEEKLNNQILDAIDQQVEANRLTEAMESGKQAQDPSNGFVVPIRVPGKDAA